MLVEDVELPCQHLQLLMQMLFIRRCQTSIVSPVLRRTSLQRVPSSSELETSRLLATFMQLLQLSLQGLDLETRSSA